jgi:low temperature requirement protein LtrA
LKPKSNNLWWGPPKKISADFQERKISWLELFFDLVYVIAIMTIWQILIVVALVVILDNSPATLLFNGTIAIMAM